MMSIKDRLNAHRYSHDDQGNPISLLDHFCAPSNMSRGGINRAKEGFYALIAMILIPTFVIGLIIFDLLRK